MNGKAPEAEAQESKNLLVSRLQQELHLRILCNFRLMELTRQENEKAFSFRGLQCVFWQLLLSLCLLRRLTALGTVVNQCQLSVVIPTQTLVQPETSSSGAASGQTSVTAEGTGTR